MVKSKFWKHHFGMLKKFHCFGKGFTECCCILHFCQLSNLWIWLVCCCWALRRGDSWSRWAFCCHNHQTRLRSRRNIASPTSGAGEDDGYFCPLGGAEAKKEVKEVNGSFDLSVLDLFDRSKPNLLYFTTKRKN